MRSRVATRFLAATVLIASTACAEDPTEPAARRTTGAPEGWVVSNGANAFQVGLDQTNQRRGRMAAFLGSVAAAPTTFAVMTQAIRAEMYRGERVRWSGWVRHTNVAAGGGALWMRVDGATRALAFDNMSDRPILGTSDWHQVSIVLDVPNEAVGITFGVMLTGPGDLIADDLSLEVVGTDVLVTKPVALGPVVSDSAATVLAYRQRNPIPVNLDFEGVVNYEAGTAEWLTANSVALATTTPGTSDNDLEPLRGMVGAARIVALGEGTHGTREFFQLKQRVLQFLVRQMGFTHFAIEASWPEANNLNHYVLTGEGDPARLLSSLYFWTWNTEEVRALIDWMREWNRTAAPARRVQFVGFDMQFPGAAIDTVHKFIGRVDPSNATFASDRTSCLHLYRNNGFSSGRPLTEYAALPASTKAACRAGLQELFDLVNNRRAEYERASAPALYENARRSARLIQQWEEMASVWANGAAGPLARDRFMAENTQWLLEQAGPTAKMMVWAHNYHVSRTGGAMGDHLNRAYGNGYVNLGFLFGRGSFNAVGFGTNTLQAWSAQRVLPFSMESIFLATGQPRLLFDTRKVNAGPPEARLLAGPIRMRSIGALYNPAVEDGFFQDHQFPREYDLLIYVAQTTPSVLLPFVR